MERWWGRAGGLPYHAGYRAVGYRAPLSGAEQRRGRLGTLRDRLWVPARPAAAHTRASTSGASPRSRRTCRRSRPTPMRGTPRPTDRACAPRRTGAKMVGSYSQTLTLDLSKARTAQRRLRGYRAGGDTVSVGIPCRSGYRRRGHPRARHHRPTAPLRGSALQRRSAGRFCFALRSQVVPHVSGPNHVKVRHCMASAIVEAHWEGLTKGMCRWRRPAGAGNAMHCNASG